MSLQPAIPWQVALPQSLPPLHRPGSECAKVVLPVENFAANGEHGLNCLCQPRGQPQYSSIVDLEKHLHRNGTQIIKILLHISYDEQLKRFLERIEEPDKNWKFSTFDIHERKYWKRYMKAYEVCFHATSTHHAQWYVVPADDKENARLIKREFPRLCRGGSKTLRIPGVYLPLLFSFCRSPLFGNPTAVAVAFAFHRLRSGPFEGPATVKPPALPEDAYSSPKSSSMRWEN